MLDPVRRQAATVDLAVLELDNMAKKPSKHNGIKMQKFSSGAIRAENVDKGRYDLISPHATIRLAKHYQNGAKIHPEDNWKLGLPMKKIYDSMNRHCINYLAGDRSEDHLAAIMWNAAAMIHQEEMHIRGRIDPALMNMPEEVLSYAKPTKKPVKKKTAKKSAKKTVSRRK